MRAVWLLFCLGLAHGSIFRRHYLPNPERFGQRLETIESYRQPSQVVQRFIAEPAVEASSSSFSSSSNDRDLEQFRYVNDEYYPLPKYADNYIGRAQRMSKPKEAYGDSVQWRGIEIAVGPRSSISKKNIESIYYEAQKAMKHPTEETTQTFHEMYEKVPKEEVEDATLNATELLKKYQYPVEEHIVKTDDGYFLTLFRIVKQTKDVVQRPVVLLMHSMLGSADDWLLMGPGKSLAYLLADEGYEVWLGNARGSKYSRRHVSRHPAQKDFWLYSNDDIALHDLPTMIDYALMTSNQPKLFYVGYDLGTTAFFALASSRPEYNDKVVKMYALSPMAYMSNVRSPLVKMIAPTSPFYENLNEYLRDGEFKPSKELVSTMGGQMFEKEIGCKKIASNVYFVMSGMNVENMDMKLIRVIMGHVPAGGSTRQVKQYGQAAAAHEFRMYDYGSEINQEVYGERVPPKYEVSKIRTPVALYYSEDDWLAHPKDVLSLKEQLPNVTEYYQVPEEYFSHMDFLYSQKAPTVVYKRLIESINEYKNKH